MRGSCIISKALKVSGGGSPDALLGILGALRGGSHFLTSGAPSCHGRRQKRKAQAQGASPQALALVGDGAGSWGEACGQTGAQEGGPPGLGEQGQAQILGPWKVPEIHGFWGHCSQLT